MWACLCCKVLACHDGQEHASAHFAKSKKQHCLFLDINEKQVFCMICQEYVVDSDQSDRTVASLVEDLHKVFTIFYFFCYICSVFNLFFRWNLDAMC